MIGEQVVEVFRDVKDTVLGVQLDLANRPTPQCSNPHGWSQDAVDVHGLGNVLQVFATESSQLIAVVQTSCGLWVNQDLASCSSASQSCRQIGHWAASREGPARAAPAFKAGRA